MTSKSPLEEVTESISELLSRTPTWTLEDRQRAIAEYRRLRLEVEKVEALRSKNKVKTKIENPTLEDLKL